jgi:phage I-like protein
MTVATEPRRLFSLLLAEPAATVPAGQLSEPFEVLRVGTFDHPVWGEMPITREYLESAVENFAALTSRGGELPIDYEHAFAEGHPEAPAAGWYRELFVEGDSLMARAIWTDKARQSIGSGEYRFFSAEFTETGRDEFGNELGFTLLSGGLTNRPFLKGMSPVSLSEAAQEALGKAASEAMAATLRETGAEFFAGVSGGSAERPREMADTPNTPETPETPEVTPEEPKPGTVTLSEREVETLREQAAQVTTLSERVTTLTENLEATQGELRGERLTHLLSQARREGRIDAKDETTTRWTERAEKYGLDEVKVLLSELPAETIPVTERGQGEDKAPRSTETPEGVHADMHALDAEAQRILSERRAEGVKDFTYRDALAIAREREGAAA